MVVPLAQRRAANIGEHPSAIDIDDIVLACGELSEARNEMITMTRGMRRDKLRIHLERVLLDKKIPWASSLAERILLIRLLIARPMKEKLQQFYTSMTFATYLIFNGSTRFFFFLRILTQRIHFSVTEIRFEIHRDKSVALSFTDRTFFSPGKKNERASRHVIRCASIQRLR